MRKAESPPWPAMAEQPETRDPPPAPLPSQGGGGGGGGALSWMSELTRALDHGIQSAGTFLEVRFTAQPAPAFPSRLLRAVADELCAARKHASPG